MGGAADALVAAYLCIPLEFTMTIVFCREFAKAGRFWLWQPLSGAVKLQRCCHR